MNATLQIISAPSILGLRPGGVARLGNVLLERGLAKRVKADLPVIEVAPENDRYSGERDAVTRCLNPQAIRDHAEQLSGEIGRQVMNDHFALVLGGDCSILIGVMAGLKRNGDFGLIFLDAHADFYEPSQSPTGEVADMDLAIVTGRGPEMLTDIGGLRPYVRDEDIIHMGQRDADEIRRHAGRDVDEGAIHSIDLDQIRRRGIADCVKQTVNTLSQMRVERYWIHFDTDVISDDENPAVDYRLPGGLSFDETAYVLRALLATGKVAGMDITIYNPDLDPAYAVATKICQCVGEAFRDSDV